jgi:uncharacterized membrane protein (DUF4010 family)
MNVPMLDALQRLLVALLLGFLIGLDRQRSEDHAEHGRFGGVRTFPLIALAGAVPVLLIDVVGPGLLVVSFLAVAAVAVSAYAQSVAKGHLGATTEVAAFITFLLGTLAGAGQLFLAGALGIGVAVLLVTKPELHAFSRALSSEEVSAALKLAVISVIVLPLLPDRGYGPWQVLNPWNIWMMVVLVTALSFAGFVAMRWLGERRGFGVTGAVGGLVSSTAVTVAMAARSRPGGTSRDLAAAAAVLASTVMCVRLGVLVGAVNRDMLRHVLPVLIIMGLSGGVAAVLLARHRPAEAAPSGERMRNPFNLTAALQFAALYAIVQLAVRWAEAHFGAGGVYAASALSGALDADAAAIALARLGPSDVGSQVAAAAVTTAAVANTLMKLGLAAALGAGSFRWRVGLSLAVMAVLGAVTGVMTFVT